MRPREVRLAAAAQRAIKRATGEAWPREMVAALGGCDDDDAVRIEHVVPFAGAGERDAFRVPPAAFASAEAQLRRLGATWLGFVHSHPRGSAAPSLADRGTLWRGCVQMIVGGMRRDRLQTAAFWFEGDACSPLPLAVVGREPVA